MSKINNITAYEPTAPTPTTILIGSEDSAGATRNYLVSALATYMSLNITTLTDLTLSGFLTVGGATTLNGNLIANGNIISYGTNIYNGATTLADTTVDGTLDVTGATTLSSTLDVTGNSQFGGQLLVSGLLQVGSFTMTSTPVFFNGISAGGTSNLGTSAFADNAAAVAGGLSVNDVYRTDGTGAAPLNVAGILMVRV